MKKLRTIALFSFVVGLPVLIFGAIELYKVNEFVTRGYIAKGAIIELRKGESSLSKYHARIQFKTNDGKIIEFLSSGGSNPPMYKVNQIVPVVFSRTNPNNARINTFIEIWLGPLIYTVLGLLLLIPFCFRRAIEKSLAATTVHSS